MNKRLLIIFTVTLLFIFQDTTYAQNAYKKFGLELNGGIREYGGDRGVSYFLAQYPNYQAFGGSFSYYINPSFDATLFGSSGDLGFRDGQGLGFTARVNDVMLGLRYKFANNYILDEASRIRPYLQAGYGGMQSISTLYLLPQYTNPVVTQHRTWFAAHWAAGAGVRIGLTESLDLSLQSLFNYSFDDNYDGLPFTLSAAKLNNPVSDNKPLHDAYLYHTVGLVWNFGSNGGTYKVAKDDDNDGVSNKLDVCPKTPEGYRVDSLGCALDDDNDDIVNEEDECPKVAGLPDFNGCPDTDGDGIQDSKDACPKKAGDVAHDGCPDSDGDGIYDNKDECPFVAGVAEKNGCPANDKDGDGIADEVDKCPTVPGLKAFAGCPDSDKDGIQDSEDKCPLKKGTKEGQGCPDTDEDGVYDHVDVCPTTPGTVANKGCPEIKAEVKEEIRLAAKGINFESGSDVIKTVSFTNLDQLAAILAKYPKAKVQIEGHTDSQGADAANQALSQKRADAVKRYLSTHGVAADRMTAIGFGEAQPIADNNTATGRAINRRVDFKLSY